MSIRLLNPEPPVRLITATLITDGGGILMMENVSASPYTVQLEAVGFDDYFEENVVVRSGGVTTIKGTLDTAQEIPLERLEITSEYISRCNQFGSSLQKLPPVRNTFTNVREWEMWWHDYGMNLNPPYVDFKRHRVAAVNEYGQPVSTKIRRITYNPRKRRTVVRVRQETSDAPSVHLTVFSCEADFVLFPANAGDVIFR